MKIAIISDIHGNKDALDAVVRDMGSVDEVWSLGDVIGYGPEPAECLDWVMANTRYRILGNHEEMCMHPTWDSHWREDVQVETKWTREKIGPENRENIAGFFSSIAPSKNVLIVHGGLPHCTMQYIQSSIDAQNMFGHMQGYSSGITTAFVGHTHKPVLWQIMSDDSVKRHIAYGEISLERMYGAIVNVGSVGQPRDGVPMASYVLYNPENASVEFRRVEYPVEKTQEKMREAGLPSFFSERLGKGI